MYVVDILNSGFNLPFHPWRGNIRRHKGKSRELLLFGKKVPSQGFRLYYAGYCLCESNSINGSFNELPHVIYSGASTCVEAVCVDGLACKAKMVSGMRDYM